MYYSSSHLLDVRDILSLLSVRQLLLSILAALSVSEGLLYMTALVASRLLQGRKYSPMPLLALLINGHGKGSPQCSPATHRHLSLTTAAELCFAHAVFNCSSTPLSQQVL